MRGNTMYWYYVYEKSYWMPEFIQREKSVWKRWRLYRGLRLILRRILEVGECISRTVFSFMTN